MTTVVASGASMDFSGAQMNDAPPYSLAASMLALTASASTGSPVWKVAPSRIVKVQVMPSSETSHAEAMPGRNSSALPEGFFHSSGS